MKAFHSVDAVLAKLEEEIGKVPGVRGVRVIGRDEPTEIHIVAASDRSAKQIVRDVQSLATAGIGLSIDHRIISIVQPDERREPPPPPPAPRRGVGRPLLEEVVLASKGGEGWVKVVLKWRDGEVTQGTEAAGEARESRAWGAASAAQGALRPVLDPARSSLHVEEVVVQKIGAIDAVTVRVSWSEGGIPRVLLGIALVQDDVATAAVRALLHAVNRRLE